jgi:hypothetical protein
MTPRLRKFALAAHVTSSVGWLGAVAAWLALAVAGLTSRDALMARSVYPPMELTAWSVIVPLCLASTLTGFVSSLGTRWGLVRHHWVLIKLLMTVPATVLLLVHMKPIAYLAGIAAETTLFNADLAGRLRMQMVAYAVAALLVLILATVLSVYKPLQGLPRESSGLFGCWLLAVLSMISGCLVLALDRITCSAPCGRRRCGATENRLHIYKRPCCASWRGPRYEPLSGAPFAVRGWARLPPRTVYRVRQLPV